MKTFLKFSLLAALMAANGQISTQAADGLAPDALMPVVPAKVESVADGIIVPLQGAFLKVEFYAPEIVRVVCAPDRAFFDRKSVTLGPEPAAKTSFSVKTQNSEAILSSSKLQVLPELQALVEVPVLLPDGTILEEPGLDPANGVFYSPLHPFQSTATTKPGHTVPKACASPRSLPDFPVFGIGSTAAAKSAPARKAPSAPTPRNPGKAQQARVTGFALDLGAGGPDAEDADFAQSA